MFFYGAFVGLGTDSGEMVEVKPWHVRYGDLSLIHVDTSDRCVCGFVGYKIALQHACRVRLYMSLLDRLVRLLLFTTGQHHHRVQLLGSNRADAGV